MPHLVPCIICRRHIQRSEEHCPFCGAERIQSAPPARAGLPRDTKRATLFALGLTLASQACGGQADVNSGLPGPGNGASTGTGTGGTTGAAGGGGSSQQGDERDFPNSIPPYGNMPYFPRTDGGSGGTSEESRDGGTPPDGGNSDAGNSDAGNSDAGD